MVSVLSLFSVGALLDFLMAATIALMFVFSLRRVLRHFHTYALHPDDPYPGAGVKDLRGLRSYYVCMVLCAISPLVVAPLRMTPTTPTLIVLACAVAVATPALSRVVRVLSESTTPKDRVQIAVTYTYFCYVLVSVVLVV